MFFSFLKRKTIKDISEINKASARRIFPRRKFFIVLFLLALLVLVSIHQASAAPKIPSAAASAGITSLGVLGQAISWLVTPILQIITFFCALFVDLAAHFLGFMLKPDLYNFTTEPMIVMGWKMCRDLCNLFFLLILLFIAFCTILQIEKYHLKKTLLTLIIMALLINFSKPIAIFIFDGSQLMMNYFLKAMGSYEDTITALSNVADIVYKNLPGFFDTLSSALKGGGGATGSAVQYIFAIIFMFMYAIALIVMAVYLLIRIVALWILIILSPFAFLFATVPDFKKMSNDWWDALFKYSYVGPAMAFFLWLSTKLGSSFFISMAKKQQSGGTVVEMGSLVSFMTVIVFLYASIIVAQKFGIQFASAITSTADKALKYGTGLNAARWTGRKAWQGTKYATKAGLKKFDRDVLKSWSPRAFVKGWQKTADEVEARHLEPGAAAWEDSINKFFGRKKPKDYKKNVQFEADVEKEMKEQRNVSTQDEALLGVIEKFKDDKSQEARAKTAAAMRLLFENNDQNEFMKQYILKNPDMFNAEVQKMTRDRLIEERKKEKKQINDNGVLRDETDDEFNKRLEEDLKKVKIDKNAGHNPDALRAALEYALRRTGMDDDQIGRQLFQLGNIALPKGNIGNYGMGTYDHKTESYKISDSETNRAHAAAKARNIDSQEKMKRLHWNAIFTENQYNPQTGQVEKVGDIHETGVTLLSQMKQTEIKQLNRSRPDLIENCYVGREKIRAEAQRFEAKAAEMEKAGDHKKAQENREIAKNIRDFAHKVELEFIGSKEVEADEKK